MAIKLYTVSAFALILAVPTISNAGTVKNIQVYNNLYNQGATGGVAGMTASTITVNFYNGATKCDTAPAAFRTLVTEVVGTGAGQKCADVTSIQIVAGTSVVNTTLQVYHTTAVTVTLTGADFEHAIIVQDIGTGVTGTAAADGSIAPIFDTTNGTVTTLGTPGSVLTESKIR